MFPRPLRLLSLLCAFPLALSLAGCGSGIRDVSGSGTMVIHGTVFGGQQPVAQSTIKLYAAGATGNGSASRSMLVLPITTNDSGNFDITADYVCANTEDQVYLVAQGGNPGLTAGTNNSALVLVSALGRCGDLPTTQFVSINELTTVAAVWALAPFITDAADIGASSTNAAGIKNGFLNSRLLASPFTGQLAVLPSNLTIEAKKLNTLANVLASCVNTSGPANCGTLFAAATVGTTVPADTLAAALNIVRNPSNQVGAVFNASSTVPPFGPALTSAPNDWTMSVSMTGGGVSSPTGLAIDAEGDAWVASYYGALTAFTPQGTPMTSTGYGVGGLSETYSVAIDPNDDAWATIEEQPHHSPNRGSIVKFHGVQSASSGNPVGSYFPYNGSPVFYTTSTDFPVAVAADTNGNMLVANNGNSTGSVFSTTGSVVLDSVGSGYANGPAAVAADSTHGIWLGNQSDNSVTHIAADGVTILAHPTTCCDGADGIAIDKNGNAWVSNYFGSSISEVSASGTVLVQKTVPGGIHSPTGVVIDANQDPWFANYRGNSISHIAGSSGTVAAGTGYSPSTGLGLDAGLLLPFGIGVDATGNVWVSNYGKTAVTMFFGLAAPTKTPVSPTPAAP